MIIPCTLSVRFANCVNKTWQESFFEVCDDYFRYGREVAILHQNISRRRTYHIREENHPIPLQELILKVLTVFTIIIPLIMAIGKAYFRSNYTFIFSEPLHPLLQTPRGDATHFSGVLSYQNAFFSQERKLSLPSRRSSYTDIAHMDPNKKPLGEPLSEISYSERKELLGNRLNLFKPMNFPLNPSNTPLKNIDLLIQKILSHPMRTIDGKNSFENLENAWKGYIKNIPSCKEILTIQKQRAHLLKKYHQFFTYTELWMQRLNATAEVENPLIANSSFEKTLSDYKDFLDIFIVKLESFSNKLNAFFQSFSNLLSPLYEKRLTDDQLTNATFAIKNLTLHANLLDLIHLLEKTVWYPGNNRFNASNTKAQKLFQTSAPYLTAGELRKIKQHFSEDFDQPVSVISYTPEEERKSRKIIPQVSPGAEQKKSLDSNAFVERNGRYFSDEDGSFRDLQEAEPSYMILNGKLIHAGRKVGKLDIDLSKFPLKFPIIQKTCEEFLQSVPEGEIHKKRAFFLEENGDIHLCVEGYPMNTHLDAKLGPLFFDSFENDENPDNITPYACPCVVENNTVSFHSPDAFYRLGKEIGSISECEGFELSQIYNLAKTQYENYLIQDLEEENDVVIEEHLPFFLKKRNDEYFVYEALDITEIARNYSEMAGRDQLSVYPSNNVIKDRTHRFFLSTDYKDNDLCLEVVLKEETASNIEEKKTSPIKASEGPFFYHEELGLVKAKEHIPGHPYFVDLDTTYFPEDSLALEQKTARFSNKKHLLFIALRNPHLKPAKPETWNEDFKDGLEKTIDTARKKMDMQIKEIDDEEKALFKKLFPEKMDDEVEETKHRAHDRENEQKKIEKKVKEMTLMAKALEKTQAKLEKPNKKSAVGKNSTPRCLPFFLTTSGEIIPAADRPALSLSSFFLREDAVYCTSEFSRDFAKAIVLQNDASNLRHFFLKDLQGFLKSRGLEKIKIKNNGR